jgi:hypothetical protein
MINKHSLIIIALWSATATGRSSAQASTGREPVLANVLEARASTRGAPLRFAVARSDSLQARFLAVYVLDTTGAVDRSSVRFVAERRPVFRQGVCEYLASTTFDPVRRAGQLRRALVVAEYRYLYRGNIPTTEAAGARYDSARAAIIAKGVRPALAELKNAPSC